MQDAQSTSALSKNSLSYVVIEFFIALFCVVTLFSGITIFLKREKLNDLMPLDTECHHCGGRVTVIEGTLTPRQTVAELLFITYARLDDPRDLAIVSDLSSKNRTDWERRTSGFASRKLTCGE